MSIFDGKNRQSFPKSWNIFLFKEVVKDLTANNPKIPKSEYLHTGVLPIVDQGQDLYGGFTDNLGLKANSQIPAIIFGDHTRIFKYITEDFCLGADGVKILEPNINLDKKFLFYYFSQLKIESAGYSRHFKFLQEKYIPCPPMAEQKRIAAILDKADAIRQKRQQAVVLAGEFLHAVFLDMFGEPVTNPKKWEVKKLGSLCKKITDGTHHSPPITERGIPYVTAKHLKQNGLQFFKNPWYISEESHKEIYSRCAPQKYDVLYIKDGATTGLAAINYYDFEFSMLSSLALLRPDFDLITPEFLCMMLNDPKMKIAITANMTGAAITRLTLSKIRDINIPLPSIELQRNFSEYYNKVKSAIDKFDDGLQFVIEVVHSLNKKAFSGQL